MAETLYFDGAPALVSDKPGALRAVARAVNGSIYQGVLTSDGWDECWWHVGGPTIRIGQDDYNWNPDSFPAVSSHATGRIDVFIVARRVRDGAQSLLHAYVHDFAWRWEFLGSGFLSGTPAVTSWGPGRIDVFVRAGENGLVHKWFESGRWSSGWEDMGAYITSSPTVTSMLPGHLDIYAVGGDRALYHKVFNGGVWYPWETLGGFIGVGTNPTATSRGLGNIDVFVYGSDRQSVFQLSYNWAPWTGTLNSFWGYGIPPVTASYWTP